MTNSQTRFCRAEKSAHIRDTARPRRAVCKGLVMARPPRVTRRRTRESGDGRHSGVLVRNGDVACERMRVSIVRPASPVLAVSGARIPLTLSLLASLFTLTIMPSGYIHFTQQLVEQNCARQSICSIVLTRTESAIPKNQHPPTL